MGQDRRILEIALSQHRRGNERAGVACHAAVFLVNSAPAPKPKGTESWRKRKETQKDGTPEG